MDANLAPDRAELIRRLFDEVFDLPADERPAFLNRACRSDPSLRSELISLIDAAGEIPFVDKAASRIIAPLLRNLQEQPAHEDNRVGRTVSHYRILERLGGGGMGIVYKARDTRLDRTVALKFLPPDLTRDPDAKARLVHEAKAASALDHNNICTIYEIDETSDGRLFIAMACYEGETIRSKIERGPLPVDQALRYAIQISDGLSRAHAEGIVHRDIKPANILVTHDGQVKILDFGLAKMAGQTQLTKTGSTLGTAAYMSPEQARGDAVDERTDVWSLGVLLYEMLTGTRPFRGEFYHAVLYSILNEEPTPVRQVNPVVPPEMEAVVDRALQKDHELRYGSAADLLKDLRLYQDSLRAAEPGAFDLRTLLRRARRPHVAVPAVGVFLLVIVGASWLFHRQSKVAWAREEVLPEVERLVEASWRDYTEAYVLAEQAERYLPDDPKLASLLARSSLHIDVETDPPGADVYMKPYDAPESEWTFVGVTPIDSTRVPVGIFRWKVEKEGYETVLAAASTWRVGLGAAPFIPNAFMRVLDDLESMPPGMVRVQGAETPLALVDDFFIDRHEVTNAQYKAFIDAGGYRDRAYWRHEFIKDGQVVSWEEAMSEFVDQTGRPGPATWQAGDFPDGQADHPVSGVSWYEAAAYAAFAGKTLPTGTHWGLARGEATMLIRYPQLGGFAIFAPFSNFEGTGTVAAGILPGLTSYGAYDMAGNVREWCWNETVKGRLIRGGGWNDNPYMFSIPSQAPPFDRSSTNGFRCAVYPDPDEVPASVLGTIPLRESRDFYKETPVSDEVFEVYKAQFDYDETDLNARLESRDESADNWIHERISIDAVYGNERLILHLFLPTNSSPPYQTVIYFPGGGSRRRSSSEKLSEYYEFPVFLSFLVKNGRAVLYPVYKGSFERQDMTLARVMRGERDSHQFAEYVSQWIKDFKRGVDYLETRSDIDSQKLAYYGVSWGGWMAPIVAAVENRLQVSILAPGALIAHHHRPEVDPINYVSRVKIPTLMLNGRYDTIAPLETSIRPLYDLLGTTDEHKELKLYETDHIPPRNEYIKETLAWLDRYLGTVE